VDTPPSRSALDFLDAPKRLGSFLDGKFIKMLMAPAKAGGRAGMTLLNVGMFGLSMVTGALSKVVGAHLLQDVKTFVAAMDTMFGGFRMRADATYRLLQAPGTAFLVVAAPERDALREASYFVERLAAEDMPLAGLVLNRVHGSGAAALTAERALAAAEALEELAEATNGKNGMDDTGPAGLLEDDHEQSILLPHKVIDHTENLPHRGIVDRGSGKPVVEPSAESLAAGLLRLHAERMQVVARERRTRERFASVHPDVPVAEVAALPGDVHDLDGLRVVGKRLADGQPTAA
jgi:anion-transporting  ArsA/GET3 family ATPase